MTQSSKYHLKGILSISPLLLFLTLYIVPSIIADDFYSVPIHTAFILSSIYAVALLHKLPVNERISIFSKGASKENTLIMIWIFLLAGCFAQTAKDVGCIDATVNATLYLLPSNCLFVGLFLASCFISLSVGTSVGTIAALVPVAVGVADKTGTSLPLLTAIVVGGSFFGDNLSFISDTTIAATRSQECDMRDKFYVNIRLVTPAALVVLVIYFIQGLNYNEPVSINNIEFLKIFPYIIVLASALLGLHVCFVLVIGTAASIGVGMFYGDLTLSSTLLSMGNGMMQMGELIIVTLLASGMLECVRYNGGINYIINLLQKNIVSKRGAEGCIASLVVLTNLCTANNTIAILTVGGITKDISRQFHIDSRKAASLLDTFSCVIQGIIPYGAQILIASQLASLSPLQIIPNLYYPYVVAIVCILGIIFRYPRKFS